MEDGFQVMNSFAPMAYLQPEAAYQFKIGAYVIIGCLGAFVWDLLENIYGDYRLVFHRKMSFPTMVYFLSRVSVLAYALMNALSRSKYPSSIRSQADILTLLSATAAPLGIDNCQRAQTAACVLYHIAFSSTALLFFLRVRAIFNDKKVVIGFFFILWLSVVAGSITLALVGGSDSLGPTDYCLAKPEKPFIVVSPVALLINDTCVFLAISWRLMGDSQMPEQESGAHISPIKRFILGGGLPSLSRALFQDGQAYYLASVASNIFAVVIITPAVPVGFRFMYVFNAVITNMMACRVYRNTKFGDFREDSIATAQCVTPLGTEEQGSTCFSTRSHVLKTTRNSTTVSGNISTPEDEEKHGDLHCARTPFIPVTRPPSRTPQQDAQKPANPQFSLDSSNPLNVSAVAKNPIDLTSQMDTAATMGHSSNEESRPLNTGSLIRRKNPLQPTTTRRPFQLPEKASTRPGTSDPRSIPHQEPSRSNSFSIVAPVPRQAPRPSSPSLSNSLASGVFTTSTSQSTFHMPGLTTSTQNDNSQSKNDAHIPNLTLGFSFSNPHAAPETQKSQQLPSPPDSLRARSGARNFVTADTDVLPPPFTLNLSGPNQTGPQRVLLNSDGTRGPPLDVEDDTRLTLDRTNSSLLKRSRPDIDIDSDHQDEPSDFKRYRAQEDGYTQHAKSVASHGSSPDDASVPSSRHRSQTPDRDPRSVYDLHNQPISPSENNNNYRAQSFYHHSDGGHMAVDIPGGLDKILGCGVNAYAEEHAEQYERAAQRWKDCTMEDWVAGADEQAARYIKILDFVRPTLSKMKLFASFDAKIDGHNNVLSEREKALEAVKARLVQEKPTAFHIQVIQLKLASKMKPSPQLGPPQCLLIPEIMSFICEQIHRSPESRPTLYVLARTCRFVSAHALRYLWSEVTGLSRLLQCMPDDLWEKVGSEQFPQVTFKRAIAATDWPRFEVHARYVRIFRAPAIIDVVPEVFQSLLFAAAGNHLFPNLREIVWTYAYSVVLPFMDLLFSSRITKVIFRSTSPEHVQLSPITTLLSRCPDIQHIEFRDMVYESISNGVTIISNALQTWQNLRNVSVSRISTEAYRHLAMLPQLDTLRMLLDTDVSTSTPDSLIPCAFPATWSSPPFLALETLHLDCCEGFDSCLPILAHMLSNHVLSSLSIGAYTCVSPSQWKTLTETIKTTCPPSLLSVSITDDNNCDHDFAGGATDNLLKEEHFEALLHFRNLSKVEICPLSFDIDNNTVERIARAWPGLVSLDFWGTYEPILSRVTLAALRSFAEHCPHLDNLSILLDGTVPCVPNTSPHLSIDSLRVLNVQSSPITDAGMAAAYLLKMTPNIDRIDSWWGLDEDSEERDAPWCEVIQLMDEL
ncbi:hypothetical protein DXG01_014600 [Tephrocybe rancida]|nr:hypothetical protein DXG01_014600 [Tephrocybe rancida]